MYTVYIWYFWQVNHQRYGHIRCIYTALANPSYLFYPKFKQSETLGTLYITSSETVARLGHEETMHVAYGKGPATPHVKSAKQRSFFGADCQHQHSTLKPAQHECIGPLHELWVSGTTTLSLQQYIFFQLHSANLMKQSKNCIPKNSLCFCPACRKTDDQVDPALLLHLYTCI